jgi:hypothetical protein
MDTATGKFRKEYAPLRVTRPVYARLGAIRVQLEQEKQRQVTFSEVLEELAKAYELARSLEAAAE